MLGGPSNINRGRNLTSIDTRYGVAVHASSGKAELIDSTSIGEIFGNEDCPEGSPCDHCLERRGIVLPLGKDGGHDDRQPKWTKLPLFKSGGSLTGYGEVENHTFLDYDRTTTSCGAK